MCVVVDYVCGADYCYVNCKDFMSTSEKRRMMTWDKTKDTTEAKKKVTSRKPRGWVYEETKPALFDDDAPSPLEPRRPGSKVGVGAVTSSSSSINADVDAGDVCDGDGDDCESVEEDMMFLSDCTSTSSSSSTSEVDSELEWEESS